ncbi:MAG: transcription antitermination factor NusB [Proteobacteria bacterium]|nr:transcription antitermination factor NusB [Pseudomonadota bacterium]HQR04512.1 transcription antitermination factor NusB [Rhodocyclaceae bacterium]
MSTSRSARHRAREFTIQGLYQWQVGGQDEAAIIAQTEAVAGYDKADADLFKTLLGETLDQIGDLRAAIEPFITRSWDDVSPIERSILLLAADELKNHLETPYRVVLNEAIELAKTFGGTDGHRFINGVLDKLAPTLRPAEAGK